MTFLLILSRIKYTISIDSIQGMLQCSQNNSNYYILPSLNRYDDTQLISIETPGWGIFHVMLAKQ